MSKVAILTFHRAVNYGAVLQTYALCNVLEQLGMQPEVIDFRSQAIERVYRGIQWTGKDSIQKTKSLISSFLLYNSRIRKNKKFLDFISKYLPMSPPFDNLNLLKDIYGVYITGSDQVFNRKITKDDASIYLLDFVGHDKKKYSYAASFGTDNIASEELEWYRDLLKDFEGISVREISGREIVRTMLGRESYVCIDPTLLLQQKNWLNLCDSPRIQYPYILLYDILSTDLLYYYVETLSKRNNIKVVCLNASLKRRVRHRAMCYIDDASPKEFLGFFQNANCIITSSFHGTAFSIIFQKPFSVVLPEGNHQNDRILSLLDIVGLQDRVMYHADYHFNIDTSIDWQAVEQRLASEREAAISYLTSIGESLNEPNNTVYP